jgi:nitrogen fixation protein NifU and related proteins
MSDMHGNLRELYQEVIFDHNRKPRNFHPMPEADHRPTATIRCAATS